MHFIKMYKEYIVIGAFTGMLGGLIMTLIYVIITGGNLGWGNFPQWLQLFGLFFGFGVTWTIFVKQTSSHLSISVGIRQRQIKGKDGSITVYTNKELFFWATNDGNARGSFKYIGFLEHRPDKIYKIANNDDEEKNKLLNEMFDPDPQYLLVGRDFMLLNPSEVSETFTIPIADVERQFSKEKVVSGLSIDICWMNAIGKIYRKEVIIK